MRHGSSVILLPLLLMAACSSSDDPTAPQLPVTGRPETVADLRIDHASPDQITIAWTEPGIVGQENPVADHDLRRIAMGAEHAAWDQWVPISVEVRPPGEHRSMTLEGLEPGSTWVFRIRSRSADTWSHISPPAVGTVASNWDQTPPDAVSDLWLQWRGAASARFGWADTGDDGPWGSVASFSIRRHDRPIDAANWVQATEVAFDLEQDEHTGRWTATLDGLDGSQAVHLAVQALDDMDNRSPVSASLPLAPAGTTWHIHADGSGDVPTLADGIRSARPGDLVLVHPGRYSWSNQGGPMHDLGMIFVGRDTTDFTVASLDGPEVTILDAEGQGRVLFIQGYNDGLVFEGFTITGGVSTAADGETAKAGGLTFHLTSTTVRDCIFEDNHGGREGGAVYFGGVGSPTLERCVFRRNHSEGYGGAVFAVNVLGYDDDTSVGMNLLDCRFEDNTAVSWGGALCLARAVIRMERCVVAGNRCLEGQGGGMAVFGRALGPTADSRVHISHCTLVGNEAVIGAAIQVFGSGGDDPRPGRVHLEQSIVAQHQDSSWLRVEPGSELGVGCTVLFGNADADTLPAAVVQFGPIFALDPEFCPGSPAALQPISPCLPGGMLDGDGCQGGLGADDDGGCAAR